MSGTVLGVESGCPRVGVSARGVVEGVAYALSRATRQVGHSQYGCAVVPAIWSGLSQSLHAGGAPVTSTRED